MSGRYGLPTQFRGVSSVCTFRAPIAPTPRRFSAACHLNQTSSTSTVKTEDKDSENGSKEEEKDSPMGRRLAQMTEDAMLEGGRSARRNIEQAGFSEELKNKLAERVAASSFRSQYAAAHSIVEMPSAAGQGTRENAAAPPWTGTERVEDTTLRMLDDASKPIRMPYKIPDPVNLRIPPKPKKSHGERIAEAKERTSTYTLSRAPGFSEEEREHMRREMRENLTPGAYSMPISISGLSSLADERIQDAIARGEFKKIRRGKGVNTKTDHNATSAFIDTTEYFMNRIIQQQEIVPPWIEKQQQLGAELNRFRERLRADWRRHAAMLIASKGGSLDIQMKRAKAYAAAETRLADKAKLEALFEEDTSVSEINTDGRIVSKPETSQRSPTINDSEKASEDLAHLPPLRDPGYLAIERSYHELAVKQINSLTRSYNLQAPAAAHKPYINLDRELNACYAAVAPDLAEEIKRRATERARPSSTVPPVSSIKFGSLGMAQSVHVREEDQSKGYGIKELWRDLFTKP
ncbi:hypothetical protein DTO013E5_4770 [Penicillium roqueforti]|uniref:DnaJ homologue, subfamily C, member 28, conserved domain n=1 Tax=Penicillium roqueforti (strain FM164) TaxID=1365484 RepID=W6Q9Q3_PENRF|nr:uncharacterized protein LCP9604111_6198 [Penicillium roqueforti]CDM26502.1 DnaJ homologue, subfamily C, member 28, conserved domain [Penicillium roqueforti FM164]KAF9247499.1 hypothetical protein LCP9604111_6198 [Penicillium roqueforti]KAI2676682.1 hypothetical protein CBS147355_5784 [Penicillium roqueforti]KAI2683557.1 hypothetical protein LCP963914a_5958 [Penicillium roqueforti]KAI2702997.1 hypothetical protein CBS147372_3312 [Penicillium roqueforti]